MLNVKLNEHSADDMKYIEELRELGVPEDVIQMSYDNTQRNRVNGFEAETTRKIIKKKIRQQYFNAVIRDEKNFELRRDEDDAQVGDTLVLQEWDGEQFTGREVERNISYVLRNVPEYGLKEGYCIMCWHRKRDLMKIKEMVEKLRVNCLVEIRVNNMKVICVEKNNIDIVRDELLNSEVDNWGVDNTGRLYNTLDKIFVDVKKE